MMGIFHTFLRSVCNNICIYALRLDFFTTFTTGLPHSTNYKNFTNLVFHQDYFGLDAEMTKMLVMVFCSLQAVTTGHILTPVDLLYQWSLVCSTQKGCENIFSEM